MLVFNSFQLRKELSMPACATEETIADQATNGNLFLPLPDTEFREFLDEVAQLLRFAPEIITAIESELDIEDGELLSQDLTLAVGRPRMPAEAVYVFLMFTIKDGFAFGELGRRGINAVRAELLENVSAYNCCRSILLRQRQREALDPRLNPEPRPLSPPIRNPFRMGSSYGILLYTSHRGVSCLTSDAKYHSIMHHENNHKH